MWSVENRTDGVIEPEDLGLIPGFTRCTEDELVAAGLWTQIERRWLISEFSSTQTTRAEHEILERARTREREKKARQRAARAADDGFVPRDIPPGSVPGDRPGDAFRETPATADVPGDIPRGSDSGQHRQARQARPGSEVVTLMDLPKEVTSTGKGGSGGGAKRGKRIPDGWRPSDHVRATMIEKYPNLRLGVLLEDFQEFWGSETGQHAAKLDWDMTFQRRCRDVAGNPNKFPQFHRANGQLNGVDQKAMGLQMRKQQLEREEAMRSQPVQGELE
jgi:hypothetical protein